MRRPKDKRERRATRTPEAEPVPRVALFPDESAVMVANPARVATLPKYIASLGLYELWRRRNTTVVTDRRILLGEGIFRRTEKSIPLSKVMDVVFTRRGVTCYAEVAVNDRGRTSVRHVGPMSCSTARRLVSEILSRV